MSLDAPMSDETPHRPTQPFLMYQNGLDMWGRIVESTCVLSMQMVDVMEKAAREAAEGMADGFEAKAPPPIPARAVSASMIPDTGDLQAASEAVAFAMNEAARRKLGALEDEGPVESAREAVAKAKASISAAKK